MMDTEAFKEFKTGLSLLRDNYATQALEHIQRAAELERNNPYYMSYLGVALARTQQKWADAERMCDSAVRLKRNQAQLYLNLNGQAYSTALAVFFFPGEKAPLEPALWVAAAPDFARLRSVGIKTNFPNPPNAKRADGDKAIRPFCFLVIFGSAIELCFSLRTVQERA
jgi:tetratricopeptide (TPR) repeat protein